MYCFIMGRGSKKISILCLSLLLPVALPAATFDVKENPTAQQETIGDEITKKELKSAAQNGQRDVIVRFFKQGGKVSDDEINELVSYAIAGNHVETLAVLMDNGANLGDALREAIYQNSFDGVEYLVERDGTLVEDKIGVYYPVEVALKLNNQPTIIDLLVSAKGANGASLLHRASQDGNIPLATYLIEDQKVNVNEKDDNGYTPLMYAAGRLRFDMVNFLIEKGAVINPEQRDYTQTALMCAVAGFGKKEAYIQTIKTLLAAGADVNVKSGEDKHFSVLGIVVEQLANVSLQENKRKFAEAIIMLLEVPGADYSQEELGMAEQEAARNDLTDILEALSAYKQKR